MKDCQESQVSQMGFNYWAFVATHWSLQRYNIQKACCLGRQVIHVHDHDRCGQELIEAGLGKYIGKPGAEHLPYADTTYFRDMGVVCDSLDFSDYEDASIIADLSKPFRENLAIQEAAGTYDAIFDIGTSEHVGNPFASIENALRLLHDGGYYFYDLPYANWMNHGLFQFCPSFFADLCRANGFEMHFQFMHPTCRQGNIIFARDNVNYFPNVITSLFGCIQKSTNQTSIKAPAQSFCHEQAPSDGQPQSLCGDRNRPLLNQLRAEDFYDYMNGTKCYPLYWSSWDETWVVAQNNLFSPWRSKQLNSDVVLF